MTAHLAPAVGHAAPMASLSPAAVLAITVVAVVVLLYKAGPRARRAARRIAVRAVRRMWRSVRTAWWASRLGIGPRLAGRLTTARWDAMVEQRKLPGLRRRKVSRTPVGIDVRMSLSGSLTAHDVAVRVRQLETGLGLAPDSARVRATGRADRLILRVRLRDPLKGGATWSGPSGPVRLADPMPLSVTPFGDVVRLNLKHRTGVFGTSGSGKSCVQRLIGAHVVAAVDADLEIWDLKFGTESQHYEGRAYRVTSVEQALDRVDWYIGAEFPRRAGLMTGWGVSSWPESPEHPARVLVVDEGNGVTRGFTVKQLKRFYRMAEQGRALGVYLVWATQFPKAVNLPTELRSQLDVMVCLKLERASESQLVFEDGAKEGWAPHRLPGTGWLLVRSDAHREPEESLAYWLSEDRFQQVPLSGRVPAEPAVPVPDSGTEDDAELEELRASQGPVSPTVAEDVWDALLLAEGPLTISELARRTGRSKGGVHAAVHRMASRGEVEQVQQGFRPAMVDDRSTVEAEEAEGP